MLVLFNAAACLYFFTLNAVCRNVLNRDAIIFEIGLNSCLFSFFSFFHFFLVLSRNSFELKTVVRSIPVADPDFLGNRSQFVVVVSMNYFG